MLCGSGCHTQDDGTSTDDSLPLSSLWAVSDQFNANSAFTYALTVPAALLDPQLLVAECEKATPPFSIIFLS